VSSGSVWHTGDLCVGVRKLIADCGGDVAAALDRLFRQGGTSYESARELSVDLAGCFEMTEAQFMLCHRRWKLGQAIF
jgi:hypothetical protein